MVDGDGKPLLAALAEGEMDRLPVNLINSLYGVENWWLQTQVDRGRKLKIYDMKKATAFLQTNGYEAEVGEDGDYRLIKSQSTENVKEELIVLGGQIVVKGLGDIHGVLFLKSISASRACLHRSFVCSLYSFPSFMKWVPHWRNSKLTFLRMHCSRISSTQS